MQSHLLSLLQTACVELNLTLDAVQSKQLTDYTSELAKWNKTYNLTAVHEPQDIMKRHVIDALSVVSALRQLSPTSLADVGTGGGVPGVILAVAVPEIKVYLIESIGKKCRFLRHVIQHLGLAGRVEVVQQRAELWQPNPLPSVIICRAFTSLANFMTLTRRLGGQDSYWLAMKAAQTEAEEKAVPKDFSLVEKRRLIVPFEAAQRHLLIFKLI